MLWGILVIKCTVNRGRFSKCPEGVARGTFTKPGVDLGEGCTGVCTPVGLGQ